MPKLPTKIPKNLEKFFWDTDVSHLNPSKKTLAVIQRLLDKGDVEAVRWTRANFPETAIKKTFTTLRDFTPRIGNYWRLFFDIPQEQVRCLQTPYLTMRKTHWPF